MYLVDSPELRVWVNKSFLANGPRSYRSALSIAFYNRIEVLTKVFASVECQSSRDFVLFISDDGSRDEVVQSLFALLDLSQVSVVHIWQPDFGFRKNRMLNWFACLAPSEHLIFVDQDCILHPKFIEEHQRLIEARKVVSGRRAELTPYVSQLLTAANISAGFIQKNYWWIAWAIAPMKDANPGKGLYLQPGGLRDYFNRKQRDIVGCNFSVNKKDLLLVNGFDTRYELPSTGEDSDLDYRLRGVGIFPKPAVHGPVQYHLWHPLTAKHKVNEELFLRVQADKKYVTDFGLYQQTRDFHFDDKLKQFLYTSIY